MFTKIYLFLFFINAVFGDSNCRRYETNVKLSVDPASQSVKLVGYLCSDRDHDDDDDDEDKKGNNKILHLTVHGLTYNHNYFDFKNDNDAKCKRSPDGSQVTLDVSVFTIHQLITKIRNGAMGFRFKKIVYVGHSFGSIIGVKLTATYQDDVDGVILTGFMHNVNPAAFAVGGVIPAEYDPKFGPTFAPNYFTLTQAASSGVFFNPNMTEAGIISENYLQRDVFPSTVFTDIAAVFTPESLLINKPVQIVIGQNDGIFCGFMADCSTTASAYAYEAPFFSPAANLNMVVVPKSGHCLNLHKNFRFVYRAMDDWIHSHV